MDKPDISIIIPTYNRVQFLKTALELFGRQTYPTGRFEVIVVDDGSTDGTENIVRRLEGTVSYRLRYFKQANSGPASARNRGVKEANAGLLLFTGDDIFPKEDLIDQHLETHKRYPDSAVLGYVEWDKDMEVSDFMNYIAPNGFQFRYASINDSGNCGFRHFYTSNISLGKEWFREDFFDEEFAYAALEDTEFAYRLEKKGLKIVLNKEAIGYHHHFITMESFCEKMRATGYCAAIFLRKCPELKRIFLPVNISFAKMISGALRLAAPFMKINKRWYWHANIAISYIEGVDRGLRQEMLAPARKKEPCDLMP